MNDKKCVVWVNQNAAEWWECYPVLGWVEKDNPDWRPSEYRYYRMVASKEQFETRINGMIRW